MNKINKVGTQLLAYKNELIKDYPIIVINSLKNSVQKIIDENNINIELQDSLFDNSISNDDFLVILSEDNTFLKTQEELLNEYNLLKSKLEEKLNNFELAYSSDFDNDNIIITKSFLITQDFIKQYFYIEDEKSFETLIKRKGFIEKFAILRLKRIMEDFVSIETYKDKFEINSSDIFFDSSTNLYGINLNINVKFDFVENDEILNEITSEIINIINNSDEFYITKMKV